MTEIVGRPMIGHGGGAPGFSTQLAYFPDEGLTVVVLANHEGGQAGAITREIAEAVLGRPR